MPHNDEHIRGLAIKLDDDGEAVLTTDADGNIDIALVEDYDEVEQAIRLLLLTRLGEDGLYPELGLPFSAMIAVSEDAYIRGVISRAILSGEPRVASVQSAQVEVDGLERRWRYDVEVVLRDGTGLRMIDYLGV